MNTLITAVEEWIDNRIARIADQRVSQAVAEAMAQHKGEVDWDEVDRRIESECKEQIGLLDMDDYEENITDVVRNILSGATIEL